MECKISCIIPFYNISKELLIDCVNSILQQDFEDYEIIIVDDGSDKAYVSCLNEIRRMDSRIQIIYQSNQGVSVARNTGIRNAKGEYITFLDADDMVVPFFFSEAYQIAKEYDAEYVVGGTIAVHSRDWKGSRVLSPKIVACDAESFRTEFIVVTEWMQDNGYFGRGPVARLIKREIVAQIPFLTNISIGEDSLWNMDILMKCNKVYKVYQIWYIYWQHLNSACHRYEEGMIDLIKGHLWEMAQRINFDCEDEAIAYFLRMYEFLRQQVFGCYLGRKECPLSVFKRARIFRDLCKDEPWNLYRTHLTPKNCDRRTRGKLFLIQSGMLYWFWILRSHVRKDPSN